MHQFVGNGLLQPHIVGILHILRLLVGLTVEIDNTVFNLERLSRQSYTTFHIVLTTVGRTGDNLTILGTIAPKFSTTCSIDGIEVTDTILCRQRVWIRTVRIELVSDGITHLIIVVCLILGGRTEGIACREVEYDDIIQLDVAQSLHTAIVPMGPFDITLTFYDGQRMLCQRHRQRRLWNTWTVTDFRYKQIITRQQRFLQRTRWNHVILEEELIDEIDGHQGKYQCIDP